MVLAPTRYVSPAAPRTEPDVPCTCPTSRSAARPHAEHCVMVLRWARFAAVITTAQQRLLNGGRRV